MSGRKTGHSNRALSRTRQCTVVNGSARSKMLPVTAKNVEIMRLNSTQCTVVNGFSSCASSLIGNRVTKLYAPEGRLTHEIAKPFTVMSRQAVNR